LRFYFSEEQVGIAVDITFESAIEKNKKGQISNKIDLSSLVALHGHFSNHFIPDLTRLATLLSA